LQACLCFSGYGIETLNVARSGPFIVQNTSGGEAHLP